MRNLIAAAGAVALLAAASVAATASPTGEAHWSGNVDEQIIVSIHGDKIDTILVKDKFVDNVTTDMSGELPRHEFSHVDLTHREGRGSIDIIQQPRAENGFTAQVRIDDPMPGRSHYDFRLKWTEGQVQGEERIDSSRHDPSPMAWIEPDSNPDTFATPKGQLHWKGDVEQEMLIYFHGNQIKTDTPSRNSSSEVDGQMPMRRRAHVYVSTQGGPGSIDVVQQPNFDNNFTAVVHIDNHQGNRARFDFRLKWDENLDQIDSPDTGQHVFKGAVH